MAVAKLPSNFAFRRSFTISDAAMFNIIDGEQQPLLILEHGIRGTQNVAENAGKNSGERDVSNIQTTQTAKTHNDAEQMEVVFGLRMNDISRALESCAGSNAQEIRESVDGFIERARDGDAPEQVAQRFARNIANGRWLWRNRVIASAIEMSVHHDDELIATFDALGTPMHHFDKPSKEEKAVAKVLAAGLRGDLSSSLVVSAKLSFGVQGSVEVFPSQNYVSQKPDGFSRPLYKLQGAVQREKATEDGFYVVGQGAIRDQKISNAIKTIDTWYPDFESTQKILSIEPNGANLDTQQFYRRYNEKASAFTIFRNLSDLDPTSDDGLYALSIIIRGGVLSVSDKK